MFNIHHLSEKSTEVIYKEENFLKPSVWFQASYIVTSGGEDSVRKDGIGD